jgi:hypothetical protein
MKYLFLAFMSLVSLVAKTQTITYEDFRGVIPFLQKEDFKGAFEKTNQLLSTTQNDASDLRGMITYMNIFSAAGMVTKDQMTHEEFKKNAEHFVGQRLVMSGHPVIDSTAKGFNSLQFVYKDNEIEGMTITANNAKTNILCFEYFRFADKINPSDFTGKMVRCGGTLQSFEVNPNDSKLWISRLYIANAFAREMTPR